MREKYLLISRYPLPTRPTHNFTHKNCGNLDTFPDWPKKFNHNRPARCPGQWNEIPHDVVAHDDVIKWNISHIIGPLCEEFTSPREFPAQRPVTRSFDVFFHLRPNKRLSKHSWGWWFETLSRSLWHHCNDRYTFYFPHVTASQIVSNVYLLLIWTSCWTNRWVAEGIRRHDVQCNE